MNIDLEVLCDSELYIYVNLSHVMYFQMAGNQECNNNVNNAIYQGEHMFVLINMH